MQPLCTRGSAAVAKSMGPSVSGAGPLRRRDIPVVTQSPCGRYVSTRGRRRRHRFFETASRRFPDMWHQSNSHFEIAAGMPDRVEETGRLRHVTGTRLGLWLRYLRTAIW